MRKKSKEGALPKKRVKEKKREYAGLASVSIVIYLLDSFADWVYRSLIEGFFGRIMTAYSAEAAAFENGFVKNHFKNSRIMRRYFRAFRKGISKGFENSFFLKKLRSFADSFRRISIRSYGNFWLSYGIYTILVYVIKSLLSFFETDSYDVLITGIIIAVTALPLLTSGETLAAAAGNSKIVGRLFVSGFGFREENFANKTTVSRRVNHVMILLGMMFGVLTFFLHPLYLPIIAGLFLLLLLIFSKPEIGVLCILALFPFLSYVSYPTISLSIMVLTTFLAYLFKVLRGKRILRFEFFDWMVVIFAVVLYFGGRISAGGALSYQEALLSCSLMLGYFLIVNLMRTKEWIKRCLVSLVASATMVSVLGIVQYFLGDLMNQATMDMRYFSDIRGRATSVFENPNVLGFYLVAIFPIALHFLVSAKTFRKRLGSFFSCSFMVLCVVLTWSRGAWVAMLITTLIFLLIHTRKTLRYLILALASIPFWAFLLPDTVVRRFTSIWNFADSSTSYRLYLWRGTWDAIREHFVGGVGYGVETYREVYPAYAYAGMASAEHSHNLFLQILFSMGIVALLFFLFLILLFVQRNLENIKLTSDHTVRGMISAAMCGGFALLIMGLFDYVWYHNRIFFLFWCIFGLSSALSRIECNDRERNQQLQISESDFATLDFEISSYS